MFTRRRRDLKPSLDVLDRRALLSGFSPAGLSTAYGLNSISFPTSNGSIAGNGAGQTIALIDAFHDSTLSSDLAAFDSRFDLPSPSLTVIDQAGGVANSGWTLEEALDVEWAHAMAPEANLVVVEAHSQSRADLLTAVNTARYIPSVSVISMSWGFPEVRNQANYDVYFQTPPGHIGITFVAASGDNGTAGGVEWPSVSVNVLSVGGTTLSTDGFGDYEYETAWSGSGGGYSKFTAEPSYQRAIQGTGKRSTPDVAFAADPNTGVQIYETNPGSSQGFWQVVGGTSLGTPAWAAIIAIADQGRALEGLGSLDGPSQTIPSIYSFSAGDFHSIPRPAHSSGINANITTGRGTPVGSLLINDLVYHAITADVTTSRAVSAASKASVKSHAKTSRTKVATVTARPLVVHELHRPR